MKVGIHTIQIEEVYKNTCNHLIVNELQHWAYHVHAQFSLWSILSKDRQESPTQRSPVYEDNNFGHTLGRHLAQEARKFLYAPP